MNMKRTSSNWKAKITPDGKALLEARRRIAETWAATGLSLEDAFDPKKLDKVAEVLIRQSAIWRQHAPSTEFKTVTLQPEFVSLLGPFGAHFKVGKNRLPEGTAESVESIQKIAMFFEKESQRRGIAYFGIFLLTRMFEGVLEILSSRTKVPSAVTPESSIQFVGRLLEMCGRAFQGKGLPKGKMDFELIDLIRIVRDHETVKLTWDEVRDAIEFAGRSVPDTESLRVFAHRARKKGLL